MKRKPFERIQEWRDKRKKEDPGYFAKYHREWRIKNPVKYLLRKALNRAQQDGKEVSIVESDINIPEICPVLKTPFSFEGGVNNSPSLDRFDCSKGYVKDNIEVISWRANKLKSDGTLEEFRSLVEWMEKRKEEKGG